LKKTTSKTFEELVAARRKKLGVLRKKGAAYPNDFKPNLSIGYIVSLFKNASQEEIDQCNSSFKERNETILVAGRIKLHRVMGKTSFAQIADHSGIIQLYLRRSNEEGDDGVPREEYNAFKKWDLGDIVGVEGDLYRTQKGELSIRVGHIYLLTKNLLPLPDKHHGLTDQEIKYRQRYLDLIVNPNSLNIFKARSNIISHIRRFMEYREFIEVETPMMHSIPGGATAKPFITHHNALNIGLYLRIAPELYLKRLIVGGFTKIFELNRNFRNEGLSPRHNPEFTMMEFYWAYADYNDLIGFIEELVREIAWNKSIINNEIIFNDVEIDFSKFQQMTMLEAVYKYAPVAAPDLWTYEAAAAWWNRYQPETAVPLTLGEIIAEIFEIYVEEKLIQPTFITEFPVEISPLARRNDKNPAITDRFELFIAGQEIANGFSELNDPDDQAERFKHQVDAMSRGNDEAMHFDKDYITALECGMPPTAGAGIGVDRLVMILLNQSNIRDVVLFPQLKPKI
jgi:lysyl-tRNA synthetase class 2